MGAEAQCAITCNAKTTAGKARLETDVLQLRSEDLKIDVPFKEMKNVTAKDGVLSLIHRRDKLALQLGKAADKWAQKILHPPTRLTKIGVKPHWRVSVIGKIERAFADELRGAVTLVSERRTVNDSDAIFLAAADSRDLKRIQSVTRSLRPDGALWIVRPKGDPRMTERSVMAAGKAAGLVDVKVVAFSPTHTAEKFVVPVKNRKNKS